MSEPLSILFAIYPDVTQLDFTGPAQVLSRVPGAKLTYASPEGGAVMTDCGFAVADTLLLAEVASCDILCVPGGAGSEAVCRDRATLAEIARLAATARYVTSVCTGSLILGAAGLLKGKRAATHWIWRDTLKIFGATSRHSAGRARRQYFFRRRRYRRHRLRPGSGGGDRGRRRRQGDPPRNRICAGAALRLRRARTRVGGPGGKTAEGGCAPTGAAARPFCGRPKGLSADDVRRHMAVIPAS